MTTYYHNIIPQTSINFECYIHLEQITLTKLKLEDL